MISVGISIGNDVMLFPRALFASVSSRRRKIRRKPLAEKEILLAAKFPSNRTASLSLKFSSTLTASPKTATTTFGHGPENGARENDDATRRRKTGTHLSLSPSHCRLRRHREEEHATSAAAVSTVLTVAATTVAAACRPAATGILATVAPAASANCNRAISDVIKLMLNEPWINYSEIPADVQNRWLDKWAEGFTWPKEQKKQIRKTYVYRAGRRYQQIMWDVCGGELQRLK
ncbi:hypothetical protein PIB30_026598 [Stylosanthes scabra]|uniref:Uncharacterized protein n=1 Tax=Stylosanthes scabra TaxID=79078 RepID=A0ABU6U975_9FABA|nr:hypothetical protein [Stylosanthes scabra]